MGSAAGAIDYLAREGDFEAKHGDLVHVAGISREVKDAIDAVDAGVRIRKGRTAERVAIATVVELPATSTPAAMAEVAAELVSIWHRRGHPAVAAVHSPPAKIDGRINNHIHLVATARPVSDGQVDRSPGLVPLRGKAAVLAERQAIADLVNAVMGRHGVDTEVFHPGRLADTGIDRPARKRVPERQYHIAGQRNRDLEAVEARKAQIAADHAAAAERRLEALQKREEKARRILRAEIGKLNEKERAARDKARIASVGKIAVEQRVEREKGQTVPAPAAPALPQLSDEQRQMLVDIHRKLRLPLPDLDTAKGRGMAWGAYKAVEAQKKLERRSEKQAEIDARAAAPVQPAPPPRSPPRSGGWEK